jgi:hypothetical protein
MRDPHPEDGEPTGHITAAAAPPDIFVMDLHGAGSHVAGWMVEGDGRTVRNAYGNHNAIGHLIVGNGNTVRNGQSLGNEQEGIVVHGNDNLISDMKVVANGASGVVVVGDRNRIKKNILGDRTQGNGGDGADVDGDGNIVEENKAFANAGDGLVLQGGTAASPGVVRKNSSGDRGDKGNLGSGIVILAGQGNGLPNPIEIESNTTVANGGAGIRIADGATGYELKSNASGGGGASYDNAGCEYDVGPGNLNATGNKINGVKLEGKDGSPFPAGCSGTP